MISGAGAEAAKNGSLVEVVAYSQILPISHFGG